MQRLGLLGCLPKWGWQRVKNKVIPLCRGLVKYAGCKKGCTQDNANPNDENLT